MLSKWWCLLLMTGERAGVPCGGASTWTKRRSVSAGLQLAQWQSDHRGDGYGLCLPSPMPPPTLPRSICTMAECTVTPGAARRWEEDADADAAAAHASTEGRV